MYFNFSDNDLFKYGALTISPYDWLEASYFYYRPSDLYWDYVSSKTLGKYLDKGFSVKFSKKFNNHTIGVGLDDFAGTGYFSREYLVITSDILPSTKLNFGIGWGMFTGENDFDNPLKFLSNQFENRPTESSNEQYGGSPTYDKWFRGDSSIFIGLEYKLPFLRGLKLKIENDPFDYNKFGCCGGGRSNLSENLRTKDSQINIGLNIPVNENFNIGINYIKGNLLAFTFSFGADFSKDIIKKDKIKPPKPKKIKENFYDNVLENLKNESIFVQTADLKNRTLEFAISSSRFRNPAESAILSANVIRNEIERYNFEEPERIEITNVNAGIETSKFAFDAKSMAFNEGKEKNFITNASIISGNKRNYLDNRYKPKTNFPSMSFGWSPGLRNHIGDPAKFIYLGGVLRGDFEVQFRRNFLFKLQVESSLFDNFDEKDHRPDSKLPNVRTDIVKYLQNSNTYVPRAQLDYIFSPLKNLYAKFSGGIFENMYGGVGGQVLYKPFNNNFSFSADYFRVKKRGYDSKFSFLNYQTNTGHFNINHYFPPLQMITSISYGKYLAGDRGYTFDISRRFKSGFQTGIFFSRTNVPFEVFGEGSFDKGFYFLIPVDLFLSRRQSGNISFKLRPLTRDGGQKLMYDNDLIGLIHHSTRSELWDSIYAIH